MEMPEFKLSVAERESEYSPSRHSNRIKDRDALIADHEKSTLAASIDAKDTLDCELNVPYGPWGWSKLDIFGTKTLPSDAPIFGYMHGGYWTCLNRQESSFMAKTLVGAGAICVAIGYELCPSVTFEEVVEQMKMATKALMEMGKKRGSRGVYVGGNCAGAYMVPRLFAIDWQAYCGIEDDYLKGGFLWSGIYDLRPLLGTYINEPLKLTSQSAWDHSINKTNHIPEMIKRSQNRVVAVMYAEYDTAEFKRQIIEFSQDLKDAGLKHELKLYDDVDHFYVMEKLILPDSVQSQDLIKWMGLAPKMNQSHSSTQNGTNICSS